MRRLMPGVSAANRPLLAAAAMLVTGAVARLAGLSIPDTISDIAHIYRREQLWRQPTPIPYLDYPLEYPVGTGLLVWLVSALTGGRTAFFCVTAALLIAAGLLVVRLARLFEAANVWLLVLAPALPLYVALNWDLFAILPMVAALLLLRRGRAGWGALALTAAVWTKFFPVVLLPLALLDRALRWRWREVAVIAGIFTAGSVALNAPFALERTTAGWRLREGWRYFFRFNQERPREVNVWNLVELAGIPLTTAQINRLSALLLLAGIGAIVAVMVAAGRRAGRTTPAGDRLLPAALSALGWWFFVNKVYSPQYSLWLLVLLALLGAPPALGVSFAAVDLAYFVASAATLYLAWSNSPVFDRFYQLALVPAMVVREGLILAIVVWAAWRVVHPTRPEARRRNRVVGAPAVPGAPGPDGASRPARGPGR